MNVAPRGGEQMLGQQIAHAVGGLDGPLEGCPHSSSSVALAVPRSDLRGAELELVIIDSHPGVRTLVGVHPDHRHHHCEVLLGVG